MAGFSRTHSSGLFCLVLLFFIMFGLSSAKEFLVGGSTDSWKVPAAGSDPLNKWAEKSRFQVGDHLLWKYDGAKDSVLQVSLEDYASCNTTKPIKKYNDGNTKVVLDHSGPYYFISGIKGNCDHGEKVIIVVLSPRGGPISHSGDLVPSASSSSSTHSHAPAPSPSNGAMNLKGGILMVMAFLVGYIGILM